MLKDIDANREHIPTSEAAKRSGFSMVHLRRLLMTGKLEGFQFGRDWFVYTDSLERYMATPHKSGPKGPIKKANRKNKDGAESGASSEIAHQQNM